MSINMLNNAPAVYIPTQPEGNGLTLPTLLSLVAHGIVIGLLIYTYQNTEIETAGSIETMMVSPEQLAEMQGQILANRAAASDGSQMDSSLSGAISNEPLNPNDSSIAAPSNSGSISQQVPVFMHSDDPSNAPILMSQEQHQQRTKQSEAYERDLAKWAAEQDEITMERLERVEQAKQNNIEENREKLKDFRDKQSNPPIVIRPNKNDSNIEINTGSSGSGGKNYSLSDGQSMLPGSMSVQSSGGNPSKSNSASDSEIKALIKKHLISPEGVKGKTALTTLTITVDSSGVITGVNTSGNDPLEAKAIEQAAWDTKKLPIGPDHPNYPTFSIKYIGTTK